MAAQPRLPLSGGQPPTRPSWFNSRHDAITERLLSISGEDAFTIDRKYKKAWTGQLQTRFFVATNEMPRFADASGALASRFIALPMWTHWKSWCEIENCREGTKSSFARNLKAAFPEISDTRPSIKGKRVRVYQGIGLQADPDEEPDPFPEANYMEVARVGVATVEDLQRLFGGEIRECPADCVH